MSQGCCALNWAKRSSPSKVKESLATRPVRRSFSEGGAAQTRGVFGVQRGWTSSLSAKNNLINRLYRLSVQDNFCHIHVVKLKRGFVDFLADQIHAAMIILYDITLQINHRDRALKFNSIKRYTIDGAERLQRRWEWLIRGSDNAILIRDIVTARPLGLGLRLIFLERKDRKLDFVRQLPMTQNTRRG